MSYIVIEGTVTPSTLLGTGERRRVARTPLIDKLVAKGFVRVVSLDPDAADATVIKEPAHEPTQVVTPARNAKREIWAAFLDHRGITYTDEDGRDELIELWEQSLTEDAELDG